MTIVVLGGLALVAVAAVVSYVVVRIGRGFAGSHRGRIG